MKKTNLYNEKIHIWGRSWGVLAIFSFLLFPTAVSIYYKAWPELSGLAKGLLGVVPVFWTVGIIEVFTFVPMLGSGGSYLAFVTGNLTNLKVPCALNAMEIADVSPNSEEGELISTIAIAVSSIVTISLIFIGILLLSRIQPLLESPFLAPAFENILPALFGALAVVFVAKDWKIAIAPLIFMLLLFVALPSLASSVSVLVPVGAIVALVSSRILYKKGYLKEK